MKQTPLRQQAKRTGIRLLTTGLAAATLATLIVPALAQKPQIDFWDMIWGPPSYVEMAKSLVTKFNTSQNQVEVVYRSVPWTNWYQTYLTAVTSKTAPCISTGAGFQAAQLYDFDGILPIDDFVAEAKKSGDANDFLAGTIESLKYKGHYIAWPWAVDTRIWYYRKDLFKKAGLQTPANWTELLSAAKKLTGGNQYAFVSAGAGNLGLHLMLTLIYNNNGQLFDANGKVDFLNPKNVQALTYLSDLIKAGVFHPASAGYNDDQARSAFARGDVALWLAGPGEAARFPDLKDKIAVLPPMKGLNSTYGTVRWVNNVMLYTNCKNPGAAKTFLKWWSANQLPLWTQGGGGNFPVRKSFTADPFFQNDVFQRDALRYYGNIGKTMAYRVSGIFPLLNVLDGDVTLHNLAQEIFQGKDVKAALEKANQKVLELANK